MGGNNQNVWWNAYYRGFYSYGLSPFYQKSISGHIGKELMQFGKGAVKQAISLGPFVALGAFIVYYANKANHDMHRKKPFQEDKI